MTPETISQLTGTALCIAVLLYFIKWFMDRDEKREDGILKILQDNTNAIREHTSMVRELKDAIHDSWREKKS